MLKLFIACGAIAPLVVSLAGCASGGGAAEAVSPGALRLAVAASKLAPNVLTGRVVGPDGKPLSEARVSCWAGDPSTVEVEVTNAMGYFATDPLADGRWHARAEHARFAPSHVVEFVVGGRQPLPMMLFPLLPGATLRVQVTDRAQKPVRHARLLVTGPEGLSVSLREAGAGAYETDTALPAGELVIRATAPGFVVAEEKFSVEAGEAKTMELTLEPAPGSNPAQSP